MSREIAKEIEQIIIDGRYTTRDNAKEIGGLIATHLEAEVLRARIKEAKLCQSDAVMIPALDGGLDDSIRADSVAIVYDVIEERIATLKRKLEELENIGG